MIYFDPCLLQGKNKLSCQLTCLRVSCYHPSAEMVCEHEAHCSTYPPNMASEPKMAVQKILRLFSISFALLLLALRAFSLPCLADVFLFQFDASLFHPFPASFLLSFSASPASQFLRVHGFWTFLTLLLNVLSLNASFSGFHVNRCSLRIGKTLSASYPFAEEALWLQVV